MKRVLATALSVLLSLGSLSPAWAHHVGVFIPKDNDITKNFKEIKFASQAGRFDVALKLFDEGIVHATMETLEKALPPGFEDGLRAALRAKNLPGVELRLALVLAFLTRQRILDATEKLRDQSLPADLGRDQTRRLLNAAWRYYNLADFVISRQDPKASVDVRTAFEDAQSYLAPKLPSAAGAGGSTSQRASPDEGKALAALTLMERTLGEVIRQGAQVARTGQAKAFLPRR